MVAHRDFAANEGFGLAVCGFGFNLIQSFKATPKADGKQGRAGICIQSGVSAKYIQLDSQLQARVRSVCKLGPPEAQGSVLLPCPCDGNKPPHSH